MNGVAHDAGPGVLDPDVFQCWKDARNVASQFPLQSARRRRAGANASAPEQSIAHDTIIIACPPRIGDGTAIPDRLLYFVGDRLGGAHIGGHRQDRARERGKSIADEGAAAEHDILGTYAAALRADPFAHAFEIGAQCHRLFEDAPAALFDLVGERQRQIERMDRKGVGIVQRLIIALALQGFAHTIRRPDQQFVAEMLAEKIRLPARTLQVVVALHIETPRHRVDIGNPLSDGRADDVHALPRQGVKRFGLIEADTFDNAREPLREAGRDEAPVAARSLSGDRSRLQHDHVVTAPGERPRRPQSGEAAADDADARIHILNQPRTRTMRHRGRGIEGVRCLACHRLICFRCHARLWSVRDRPSPESRGNVARTPCAD
jgi:hypothetical protein